MKHCILIIIALLLQLTAKTQITFEKIITSGSTETAWSVIRTFDGGYAFLGNFGASPGYDRWLVRTNNMGDTLWSRTFRGIGNDLGDRALVQAVDHGFTFITNRNGKAGLLHVSSSGDSLWEKELFSGIGLSVARTSSWNYIVTGQNATGPVIHLALAGTDGNLSWDKTYSVSGTWSGCRSWTVREIPGIGYVAAGEIMSNYGYSIPFVFKAGPNGDSTWCRSYSWFMGAAIYSADTILNGDLYVGGIEHNTDGNTMVMRLNSSGDTVWTRVQTAPLSQYFNSIRSTGDGGAIACGSYSNTSNSSNVYLTKYSSTGAISWQRKIGNYKNSYGLSVEPAYDNGYIICGQVQETATSGQHALLIKTDANGNFAGIENHVGGKGYYFYPNPASDITTLSLVNIPNCKAVIIRLYDLFGRQVKTILTSQVLQGYTLDVTDLPDGIYLAVIESDGQTIGRAKLVKQ